LKRSLGKTPYLYQKKKKKKNKGEEKIYNICPVGEELPKLRYFMNKGRDTKRKKKGKIYASIENPI